MKKTSQIVLATVSLLAAGLAQAGPPVEVTFKNLGVENAVFKMVTSNETSTYQIAQPRPAQTVAPGALTRFDVQRVVSPDVNGAMVRYTQGRKTCAFGTTFQMRVLPGNIKQPQWTKTATPSGGATCTATITRTNSDYSWAVEFTMR
ncbi:hypothetical protein [Pseudomonas sp. GD03746]|uniref:hypothetical protein n=1 Tax=Pseudomonas sp. GD03746 TaxID=2975378 RepID=UPI00244A1732|nr:hypothetical protein [Pseudomonas sp. GD03746]MDH1574451.1 hypothetical protein [Pseudomonas sp. GD03746]HEN8711821.1 hypothetical protein [Pseudomonas putida]HEN8716755.1 hypothetical protein [Pseudomonas putida]